MYRPLVLLFVTAASSAPDRGDNSDITYVKIQPLTDQLVPVKAPYRESRIENLPLTIPGYVDPGKRYGARRVKGPKRDIGLKTNEPDNPLVNEKGFERILSQETPEELDASGKPKSVEDGDRSKSSLAKRSPDNASVDLILSETAPLEANEEFSGKDSLDEAHPPLSDSNRQERSEHLDSLATTIYDDFPDTTEPVTEKNESLEELAKETDEYETRTPAPVPRFLSKLSYFQNPEEGGSLVTNFIERASKRRFKSKCRCEKLSNCPKLQITVPRCPNDYFMCCF